MKDWTGNSNSIYKTLGASNHTDEERQIEDFYSTEPKAVELLLENEKFEGSIWECACGSGDLSKKMIELGYQVVSTDLVERGFGTANVDFLTQNTCLAENIITNPPYKFAKEFVYKSLELLSPGKKVAMFLKLQFMEGKERKKLFTKYPPKTIYVSSSRLLCAKNGEFDKMIKGGGSAVAYAWYVWVKDDYATTQVKWIN